MIKVTGVFIAIVIVLYLLQVRAVVEGIDGLKVTWNLFIEGITHMKDRHPYIFLSMIFVAIFLVITGEE